MIDTNEYSAQLRARSVRASKGELLVSVFSGSGQEGDLTDPPNCGGVGRVRHFHRETSEGWPPNPLPIDPARAFLGLPPGDRIEAQVFQNAACNWRCWYCYVPFNMLAANESLASWVTAAGLVEQYVAMDTRPPMIDLTGGQPDLVPEWVPWMMTALEEAGASADTYLWSDDNLSNDYYFRYLSTDVRHRVAEYRGYGRVCCFKGFDEQSFSFNTMATADLFDQQFKLFSRLLAEGLDLYAYTTFTGPSLDGLPTAMRAFVDRLQRVADALPLRTVPLEIAEYGPVTPRMKDPQRLSLGVQHRAIEAWNTELDRRFTSAERALPIVEVPLGGRS